MKFGLKKGSSKEITIDDLSKRLKAEADKRKESAEVVNPTELLLEVCYDLAEEKSMNVVVYLEDGFIYEGSKLEFSKILNVKFTKKRY